MIPARPAIVLDVEGTTTPLEFVYDVLFPFARARLAAFLEAHAGDDDVRAELAALRAEHAREASAAGAPAWDDAAPESRAALPYAHWLMDRDRKSTGLKALQGRVWEAGYRSGALRGALYADVRPALERWHASGRRVAIFSSGSVLAQRLLFGHSSAGDLRPLLFAHFDTTTGSKLEAPSYLRIAAALGQAPADVLFVSDVERELDAARAAGLCTALCVRPGRPAPAETAHASCATFDELGC